MMIFERISQHWTLRFCFDEYKANLIIWCNIHVMITKILLKHWQSDNWALKSILISIYVMYTFPLKPQNVFFTLETLFPSRDLTKPNFRTPDHQNILVASGSLVTMTQVLTSHVTQVQVSGLQCVAALVFNNANAGLEVTKTTYQAKRRTFL